MKKYWFTLSALQGHLAMWAIRLSPYHNPECLEAALDRFRARVSSAFDQNDMACMDKKQVQDLVDKLFLTIPFVLKWNERKNGNKAPFVFCSRYDKPNPDDDFIDLGALARNAVHSLFQELEHDNP